MKITKVTNYQTVGVTQKASAKNTSLPLKNKSFGSEFLFEDEKETKKKRNIIIGTSVGAAVLVSLGAFLGTSAYMRKNKWKDIDLTKSDVEKDINFFKKGMIKTGDWLNNLFKKSGSKPKK